MSFKQSFAEIEWMPPWKETPIFPKQAFIKHSSVLNPLRWVRWGRWADFGPVVTITILKAAGGERNPDSREGHLCWHSCWCRTAGTAGTAGCAPGWHAELRACWDTAQTGWTQGKLTVSNCASWTLWRGRQDPSPPWRVRSWCRHLFCVAGRGARAQMVSSDHPRRALVGQQALSDVNFSSVVHDRLRAEFCNSGCGCLGNAHSQRATPKSGS